MVLLIDTHTECMHGINLYVASSPSCSSGETTDVCDMTSPVMEGLLVLSLLASWHPMYHYGYQ